MSALLDLALRCEAATGPDRELDLAIAMAVGWTVAPIVRGGHPTREYWTAPGEHEGFLRPPPGYTRSLDAPMTLLPDGREWSVRYCELPDKTWAAIARIGEHGCGLNTSAATPALALCAAALRARAVPKMYADLGHKCDLRARATAGDA